MCDKIMEEMLLDDGEQYPQDEFALYLFEILESDPANNTEMKLIQDMQIL